MRKSQNKEMRMVAESLSKSISLLLLHRVTLLSTIESVSRTSYAPNKTRRTRIKAAKTTLITNHRVIKLEIK